MAEEGERDVEVLARDEPDLRKAVEGCVLPVPEARERLVGKAKTDEEPDPLISSETTRGGVTALCQEFAEPGATP